MTSLKYAMPVVLFVLAVLGCSLVLGYASASCQEKGGELVENASGWMTCSKVIK